MGNDECLLTDQYGCDQAHQAVFVEWFEDIGLISVPGYGSESQLDLVIGHLEHPVYGIQPLGLDTVTPPCKFCAVTVPEYYGCGTTTCSPVEQITIAGWGKQCRCITTAGSHCFRMRSGDLHGVSVSPSPFNVFSVSHFDFGGCPFPQDCPTYPLPPCEPSDCVKPMGNLGDSGSPLLIERGCELRVIGIVVTPGSAVSVTSWNDLLDALPNISNIQHLTTVEWPCPCVADFNLDGQVTDADVFAHLTAWFGLSCIADVDGTPGVGVSDISAFLGIWYAGCP